MDRHREIAILKKQVNQFYDEVFEYWKVFKFLNFVSPREANVPKEEIEKNKKKMYSVLLIPKLNDVLFTEAGKDNLNTKLFIDDDGTHFVFPDYKLRLIQGIVIIMKRYQYRTEIHKIQRYHHENINKLHGPTQEQKKELSDWSKKENNLDDLYEACKTMLSW